jgi:hypothetical protein
MAIKNLVLKMKKKLQNGIRGMSWIVQTGLGLMSEIVHAIINTFEEEQMTVDSMLHEFVYLFSTQNINQPRATLRIYYLLRGLIEDLSACKRKIDAHARVVQDPDGSLQAVAVPVGMRQAVEDLIGALWVVMEWADELWRRGPAWGVTDAGVDCVRLQTFMQTGNMDIKQALFSCGLYDIPFIVQCGGIGLDEASRAIQQDAAAVRGELLYVFGNMFEVTAFLCGVWHAEDE